MVTRFAPITAKTTTQTNSILLPGITQPPDPVAEVVGQLLRSAIKLTIEEALCVTTPDGTPMAFNSRKQALISLRFSTATPERPVLVSNCGEGHMELMIEAFCGSSIGLKFIDGEKLHLAALSGELWHSKWRSKPSRSCRAP